MVAEGEAGSAPRAMSRAAVVKVCAVSRRAAASPVVQSRA